jgi:hypothetical protein
VLDKGELYSSELSIGTRRKRAQWLYVCSKSCIRGLIEFGRVL